MNRIIKIPFFVFLIFFCCKTGSNIYASDTKKLPSKTEGTDQLTNKIRNEAAPDSLKNDDQKNMGNNGTDLKDAESGISKEEAKLPYRKMPDISKSEISRANVSVDEILNAATKKEDYGNELDAIDKLGYAAYSRLTDIFMDPKQKWEKRWISAMAIGRMWTLESRMTLLHGLKDPFSTVRMSSLIALKKFPDDMVIDRIHDVFLNDRSMFVRNTATEVLSEIRDPRSIEVLVSGLKNEHNLYRGKNLWIRNNIVKALGKYKNKKVIPHLINILSDNETSLFTDALNSLETINRDNGDMLLIKDEEASSKVKWWLAWWERHKKDYL